MTAGGGENQDGGETTFSPLQFNVAVSSGRVVLRFVCQNRDGLFSHQLMFAFDSGMAEKMADLIGKAAREALLRAPIVVPPPGFNPRGRN